MTGPARLLAATFHNPNEEHTYRELDGVTVALADGTRLFVAPIDGGAELTIARSSQSAVSMTLGPVENYSDGRLIVRIVRVEPRRP